MDNKDKKNTTIFDCLNKIDNEFVESQEIDNFENGIDLAKKIKEDGKLKKLRIVLDEIKLISSLILEEKSEEKLKGHTLELLILHKKLFGSIDEYFYEEDIITFDFVKERLLKNKEV